MKLLLPAFRLVGSGEYLGGGRPMNKPLTRRAALTGALAAVPALAVAGTGAPPRRAAHWNGPHSLM